MRRFVISFVVLSVVVGIAQDGNAEWFARMRKVIARDAKRNNAWPYPFVKPARANTKNAFFSMIDNGWHRQNLLSEHYFDPNSSELTRAGKLKVRWILTEAPKSRRVVFVQRSFQADMTAKRMVAVQELAVDIVPEGQLPMVIESNLVARGAPADYLNLVDNAYDSSTPLPRLREIKRDEGP